MKLLQTVLALAGLLCLSSYVVGGEVVRDVNTTDREAQRSDSDFTVERDPRPIIRFYSGHKLRHTEVFILLLDPHLTLTAVDDEQVIDSAREYHLLPGFHKLRVDYHEWTSAPPPGYSLLSSSWQSAESDLPLKFPAGRRGILEYRITGKKIKFRLMPLGPSDLDGRWLGTIACELCANCVEVNNGPISIDVHNSRFEIVLDEDSGGQGQINENGLMMIRKKGKEIFSFFGTLKEDSFQLRGRIGSSTCKITIQR